MCCGSAGRAKDISKSAGYSDAEVNSVPEGANLGLGCGNPAALAGCSSKHKSFSGEDIKQRRENDSFDKLRVVLQRLKGVEG